MTIREELLKADFSDEEIDFRAKEAYQERITPVPPRKKFFDTKIGRIISFDLADYLIQHYSLKLYEKERKKESEAKRKELEEKGFQGDKNNGMEVLQYEESLNRQPVSTIEHGNGCFTHIYQDGLQVNVKVNIQGFIDDDFLNDYEIYRKRLIADYLGLEEASLIGMKSSSIDQLIEYNERLEKGNKFLIFSSSDSVNEKKVYKLKQKQVRLNKR